MVDVPAPGSFACPNGFEFVPGWGAFVRLTEWHDLTPPLWRECAVRVP